MIELGSTPTVDFKLGGWVHFTGGSGLWGIHPPYKKRGEQ